MTNTPAGEGLERLPECAICGKVSRMQDPLTVAAFASVFIETGEPDWLCKGHDDE